MESVVPPANPKRCADVRASMPLKKKTVINRMANLKKKLKELTILCDTQGFLVCSCPSLGTQVWPEDPEALLSRIQQFKETRKRRVPRREPTGGL
ncbi:hypothetical protein H6P81_013647 [Aristolochia fimbriata]|uniref:MADS-box domain-containing protein n=1 Tax=Aristolochia fimbriata TaxID=158543 RepID=A0AAV7EGX3_ARIFI|nr:hypothetical protein H6P81_013647 [Aristolochia fimbriata]